LAEIFFEKKRAFSRAQLAGEVFQTSRGNVRIALLLLSQGDGGGRSILKSAGGPFGWCAPAWQGGMPSGESGGIFGSDFGSANFEQQNVGVGRSGVDLLGQMGMWRNWCLRLLGETNLFRSYWRLTLFFGVVNVGGV